MNLSAARLTRAGLLLGVGFGALAPTLLAAIRSEESNSVGVESSLFRQAEFRERPYLTESPDGSRWLATWHDREHGKDDSPFLQGIATRSIRATTLGLGRSSRSLTLRPEDGSWWLRQKTLIRAWRLPGAAWCRNQYLHASSDPLTMELDAHLDLKSSRVFNFRQLPFVEGEDEALPPVPSTAPLPATEDEVEAAVEGLGYRTVGGSLVEEVLEGSRLYLFKVRRPNAGIVGATRDVLPQVRQLLFGEVEILALARNYRQIYFWRGSKVYRTNFQEPLPSLLRRGRNAVLIPTVPEP